MRALLLLFLLTAAACADVAIEIDLTTQEAHLLRDGRRLYTSAISSGRADFPTPTGRFRVREKDPDHASSKYGRIVDARGRQWLGEAEESTALPAGGKFIPSPMRCSSVSIARTACTKAPSPATPPRTAASASKPGRPSFSTK